MLVHVAFENISHREVPDMAADFQKEEENKEGTRGNGKDDSCRQNVVPGTHEAEGSNPEDGRQDEYWSCAHKKEELSQKRCVSEQILRPKGKSEVAFCRRLANHDDGTQHRHDSCLGHLP